VQALTGDDGKMYAAPFYGESSFLMYNKAMFEAKGLSMPEHPTWAQVADFAAKLDDKAKGVAGICLRGLPGWGELFAPLTTVVNTYGGTWFTKDWTPAVNAPEFTAATDFYVDLVRKHGEAGAPQAGFTECLNTFGQGKAAMWYDATSAAGTLEDPNASKVSGKVGYVYAPVNKTEYSGWLWTWAWAMPKTTKKAEVQRLGQGVRGRHAGLDRARQPAEPGPAAAAGARRPVRRHPGVRRPGHQGVPGGQRGAHRQQDGRPGTE
jgi:sorbitol/mannitol transport system substrate-binding protein